MEAHITREDEFKVINDVNEILVKVLVAQGEKGDKGDPGNISSVKVNGTEITPVAGAVDITVPTDTHINDLISNAISGITGIDFEVVEELPATGENGTIYLILNGGSTPNIYDEYIYVNGAFEKIGTTEIDLSHYVQDTRKINNKPLSSDINLKTSDLTNDSDFVDKDYLENGKNLFNKNNYGYLNAYINSTGPISQDANFVSIICSVKPNTTFTLTKPWGYSGTSYAWTNKIAFYQDKPTASSTPMSVLSLGSTEQTEYTFTTPANCNYILFGLSADIKTTHSDWQDYIQNIQLEEGSEATPYEKYYGKYLNNADIINGILSNNEMWRFKSFSLSGATSYDLTFDSNDDLGQFSIVIINTITSSNSSTKIGFCRNFSSYSYTNIFEDHTGTDVITNVSRTAGNTLRITTSTTSSIVVGVTYMRIYRQELNYR